MACRMRRKARYTHRSARSPMVPSMVSRLLLPCPFAQTLINKVLDKHGLNIRQGEGKYHNQGDQNLAVKSFSLGGIPSCVNS